MNLVIEDELLQGVKLSESQARLDFALGLFVDRRVTLGRAAAVAGLNQAEFLRELGKRGIPMHYDLDDLQDDLRTIDRLHL
ncbi:MAG: UPF0175 family protein [Verrucomicrobia bacterium]|nr:UPF0175 family protein [Verrucomicrobiota bacterium]